MVGVLLLLEQKRDAACSACAAYLCMCYDSTDCKRQAAMQADCRQSHTEGCLAGTASVRAQDLSTKGQHGVQLTVKIN